MDWGNVTAGELLDALQEVEWTLPPRPLVEYFDFSRFTIPRSFSKWTNRVKCNLYYYRTNYFIQLALVLGMGFLRNPLALMASLLAGFAIACLNDSFAATFSEKLTRTVRRFSTHLAAKMRPKATPVIRGRRAKGPINICGQPRNILVFLLLSVNILLTFISGGIITGLWALLFGLIFVLVHASFRSPNLKARLNTSREEFRAVWRSYSDL
uniref:PRA1 family protein n=1 Tax=Wollemia nobilis TaxID=56998 RepID=A0A0C9S1A9_9CONI